MRTLRAAQAVRKSELKGKTQKRINLLPEERERILELSRTMNPNDIARLVKRAAATVRDVINPGYREGLNSIRSKKRNPDQSLFDWNDYKKKRII